MLPQPRFPDGLDGNFTAYIPRQLTTFDLRLAAAPPEAVGFPRKITYAGSRQGLTTTEPRHFLAEYRPRFESFIHAASCRKLSYAWVSGGRFHVDVLHNRETGEWNIYKFRAGRLLSHVCAQGYGEAMIRASGIGLQDEEPGFTFAGDPEECRLENLAQSQCAGRGTLEDGHPDSQAYLARTLVFGLVQGEHGGSNLIIIPREKAEELAAIRGALQARTWGEFRVKMPAHRLHEVLHTFPECGAWAGFDFYYRAHARTGTRGERETLWAQYEALAPGQRVPLDEDAFVLKAVPGAGRGHWPERPEQAMLRWLPPLICGRFGRRVSRRSHGDFMLFGPERAPEILAALEAAGFVCCWDEELVRAACGGAGAVTG